MKTTTKYTRRLPALIAGGLLAASVAFGPMAVVSNAEENTRSSQIGGKSAKPQPAKEDTKAVRITRATTYLGSDVMSTDNRKVGDIVDYVFDVSQTPHLAYVVIMSGGFLNVGGETRAVPAGAITTEGDTCHINLGMDEFWGVPLVADDVVRHLSNDQSRETIAAMFNDGTNRSRQNRQSQSQARDELMKLVTYGDLRNADIHGSDGQRLGFVVDAWVNLDTNRVPFIEINPTYNPFRSNYDLRHAIPLAAFERKSEFAGYEFDITGEQLVEAESVTATEGVKMLQSGEIGDTVLRVRLAKR